MEKEEIALRLVEAWAGQEEYNTMYEVIDNYKIALRELSQNNTKI